MFRLLLRNKPKAGFTLIELLIYMAVFAIAVGLLSGILVTFTRVQGRESASAEVTQQLAFVQTTIQRLVREAVNIENQPGVFSSTLTLRMASPSSDPTIISSDADGIYLKQGLTGAVNPLTNNQVKVANFQVVKYENPGGHAIVQLDFSLTYNSQRVYQQITRGLKTSIGRVTAATFDDSLLPNTPNSFIIGNSTYPWKSLTLSELLNLGQLTVDPVSAQNGSIYYNSVDNAFRGYKNNAWADLGVGWAASAANIYNTNSGNVGIGTPTPGASLHLYSSTASIGQTIESQLATGYAYLRLKNPSNTASPAIIGVEGSGGGGLLSGDIANSLVITAGGTNAIQFGGNNVSQVNMTILNSGNVGIGTPSPGQKLTVTGTIESTSGGIKFPDGTTQTTAAAPATALRTYDSGWFAIAQSTTYTKTHNLGTTKILSTLYYSESSDGSGDVVPLATGYLANYSLSSQNYINIADMDTTTIAIRTAPNNLVDYIDKNGTIQSRTSGYLRVLLLALE